MLELKAFQWPLEGILCGLGLPLVQSLFVITESSRTQELLFRAFRNLHNTRHKFDYRECRRLVRLRLGDLLLLLDAFLPKEAPAPELFRKRQPLPLTDVKTSSLRSFTQESASKHQIATMSGAGLGTSHQGLQIFQAQCRTFSEKQSQTT